jgi:hypothetical protein
MNKQQRPDRNDDMPNETQRAVTLGVIRAVLRVASFRLVF